jgi:ubiquinone/menaquinone biosynthesis C-methylase UbiE
MATNFDAYASDYRDIINCVSKISGEDYEYFVRLRIALMRAQLGENTRATSSSPKQSAILDFGCGTGATEIELKKSFPRARIYGLDTSLESIVKARKLALPDVIFMMPRESQLPLDNGSIDLIYSNGTFHHMDHASHVPILSSLRRVLKKKGRIFIFENNPYNPLMMRAMKNNPFDKEAHVIYPNCLKTILTEAGFRINTTHYYFFFPRVLKVLRPVERYLHCLPLGAQYFVSATK